MTRPRVIFFGNGPLSLYAMEALTGIRTDQDPPANATPDVEIIFHAQKREDLDTVRQLKQAHPEAHGVLASFGHLIKSDILELFEPEGILNIHPSKLPEYRGPSPIESAILDGRTQFGTSVMKLVPEMDAGPLYYQNTLELDYSVPKIKIYRRLAQDAGRWIHDFLLEHPQPIQNPANLPPMTLQDGAQATFSKKLEKTQSLLDPAAKTALELHNQVRAFSHFPKSRYEFFGVDCIILEAHVAKSAEITPDAIANGKILALPCKGGDFLVIDQLQPSGKKPMDAKSFINGYGKGWV